jgi:hypothetical protein
MWKYYEAIAFGSRDCDISAHRQLSATSQHNLFGFDAAKGDHFGHDPDLSAVYALATLE